MSALDRQALANDLESIGLKAISSSVRNGALSLERVMRSVERTRDKRRAVGMNAEAAAAQAILNQWWGKGDAK